MRVTSHDVAVFITKKSYFYISAWLLARNFKDIPIGFIVNMKYVFTARVHCILIRL